MRELIKQVLEETIQRKYNRLTPDLYNKVYKLIGSIFNNLQTELDDQHADLNMYRVNFCSGGKRVATFGGGDTDRIYAKLSVDDKIVKQIQSVFNIRKLVTLNFITEYFEDNLLDKMSNEIGIQFTDLDDVDSFDFKGNVCISVLDQGRPELSREKMIEYILSNTLFRKAQLEREPDATILEYYRDVWRKIRGEELKQR